MDTEYRTPHVLVVDEAPEIRNILSKALHLSGFRVTATDSVQDVAAVRQLAPDCIVHEFLFNRESSRARAFLHALRQDSTVASIPVLLCTVAHETVANPALTAELQFLDVPVLLKPFDLQDFLVRVALASAALHLQVR